MTASVIQLRPSASTVHLWTPTVTMTIATGTGVAEMTLQPQRGYLIQEGGGPATITCLTCQRTSANPKDVTERYCGHCHVFHDR